jgi:hypothetical protein
MADASVLGFDSPVFRITRLHESEYESTRQNPLDSSTERTPMQVGQEQPCASSRDRSRRGERSLARYLEDPALVAIVEAWPNLSAGTRQQILAIVAMPC